MSAVDTAWARFGVMAKHRRMVELRRTQQELAARHPNLSSSSIQLIEAGKGAGRRASTVRALCDALGWTHESIDEILNGGDPILVHPPGTVQTGERPGPEALRHNAIQEQESQLRRRIETEEAERGAADFVFSDVKIALDADDGLFPAQREAMKQLYDSFLETNKLVGEREAAAEAETDDATR